MTKEELKSLKKGDSVMHKQYGVCEVSGHSMPIGVDLRILNPFTKCFGHDEICETRHNLLTLIVPMTKEEFDQAFQESVERTKRGECDWQKQLKAAGL